MKPREREAARNSDFSWTENKEFSLACKQGVWDEEIDPNLISMRSNTVSKERKSECFFYPHTPGMTFEAAKNLQEKKSTISQINTGIYIAGDQFIQTGDFRESYIKSNPMEFNQSTTKSQLKDRFPNKQRKRDLLRDFLANDLRRMGELILGGASLDIRIDSQPRLARLLDELIRKTSAMEIEFITDEILSKTFTELGKLGRLAWDHQITQKHIKDFLDCEQRLKDALVSLEEELNSD